MHDLRCSVGGGITTILSSIRRVKNIVSKNRLIPHSWCDGSQPRKTEYPKLFIVVYAGKLHSNFSLFRACDAPPPLRPRWLTPPPGAVVCIRSFLPDSGGTQPASGAVEVSAAANQKFHFLQTDFQLLTGARLRVRFKQP